jgi:hypothetical protein
MRRGRITGLLVAGLLAVGCAATSAASAKRLTLSEGGVVLAPGSDFELLGNPGNFSVDTSAGEVECFKRTTMSVETITNSKASDELSGLDTNVNGGNHCESDLGNVFPGLTGERLLVRATGKATIESATLFLFFELGDKECLYPTKSLKGENTATATREPLSLFFSQRLKRSKSSSPSCPTEATLDFELPEAFGEDEERDRIEQQT